MVFVNLKIFLTFRCVTELDDFLQELDEDVEGMQSTILFLQQELKTTRDRIHSLEKENAQLRQITNERNQKEATESATETKAIVKNGENTITVNNSQSQESGSRKLETIEENACPETNTNVAGYYNGSNVEQQQQLVSSDIITEDCSNSNPSKNGNVARLARKRNYEDEPPVVVRVQEAPVVPAMREINTPRTLPPKKSKLRGIATRRSSQLDEDQTVISTPLVLDNAVPSMISEDPTPSAASVITNVIEQPPTQRPETETVSTAPERIQTRRRSVRMQQNGSGGIDY